MGPSTCKQNRLPIISTHPYLPNISPRLNMILLLWRFEAFKLKNQ